MIMKIGSKIIAVIGVIGAMSLAGCAFESGSEYAQNENQKQILEESNRQLGMPNITNFFEKETAKKIWELRDDPDLTTYAYFQNMEGQFVYLGRCIGYGLPYTTQYTNPQTRDYSGSTGIALPQADPNGLYSSETTNATWLMLVNDDTNETEVIYSEPEIVVTQSKLPSRLCASWSLPSNY